MSRFDRLDLAAGSTLAVIALAIAGLVFYFNSAGVIVSLHTINPRDAISPYERITLRFSEPVVASIVENHILIQPETAGVFIWLDQRTVQFIPSQPFRGIVTIDHAPGLIGQGKSWLRRTLRWTLTVRSPEVIYLNYSDPQRELMSIPYTGGTPKQITHTSGQVLEFSVSASGNQIVYAVRNDQQGMDLWLTGRAGETPHLLLDCGAGRCTNPAWSSDEQSIAYSRAEPFGASRQFGAPRPRIINLQSGQDRPLFGTREQVGYGASWSPDGQWLAVYDGMKNVIHVVNLNTGEDVSLPSNYGLTGTWSPDSRYFFYANVIVNAQNQSRTILFRADFQTGDIEALLGKENDRLDAAFALPAWSPRGDQAVIGLRTDAHSLARQLWLVNPISLGGPTIASEPDFTYDFYQWDPWGTALVFQQTNLTDEYHPAAVVWTPIQGTRVLVENAIFPRWLP
ncbi:MAG: hypothetical protein OHK0010_32860 [Anaerolineales bacterium]